MDPIPIFPEGALRESVITTVWVGVWVISLLNLRLGWTYSGLVAPGYLVPLLLIKPISACVIVLEAILAYGLVWFISEVVSKAGWWSNLFGRDRFFALLLSSVIVRLLIDGWLLPELAGELEERNLFSMDFRGDLHSFGTIIVALIANSFWKPGLRSGLFTFAVTTGATYILVRHVLAVVTNFNIGGLDYMYEDFAQSFLASPKAYIVLLTVAWVASRLNLLYGWEYNGILLPALLGLLWYQPAKIVTSFVEAVAILLLVQLAIRAPIIREWTIEGARKTLLFFNLAFIYKLALGHFLPVLNPAWQITDFYGFGYLLPTLIAIKVHDKSIPLRLSVGTVVVAFAGALLASVLGFAISRLPMETRPVLSNAAGIKAPPVSRSDDSPRSRLIQDKVAFYDKLRPGSFVTPLDAELEVFNRGLRHIKTYQRTRNGAELERAQSLLYSMNFQVEILQSRFVYISENQPARGWGLFLIDLQTPDGLVIEVPAPINEWNALESAMILFDRFRSTALAVGGAGVKAGIGKDAELVRNRRSVFHVFHRVFQRPNVIQVRGLTPKLSRLAANSGAETGEPVAAQDRSTLWVKKTLPVSIDLQRMKDLLGDYAILWRPPPIPNVQADETPEGYAELWLSRDQRRELIYHQLAAASPTIGDSVRRPLEGDLNAWLLEREKGIAPEGSNLYRPPSRAELLYLDNEIFTPLMRLCREEVRGSSWSAAGIDELRILDRAARGVNCRIVWFRSSLTEDDYLIVVDDSDALSHNWGTFVMRRGLADPILLEVPRPLHDAHTFEFGISLFERIGAEAISIAGAHRFANSDGSSDILKKHNQSNAFNLWTQVWMREASRHSQLALQIRAFAPSAGIDRDTDALLFASSGAQQPAQLRGPFARVAHWLDEDDYDYRMVDGSRELIGYGGHSMFGARYLTMASEDQFGILWLAAAARNPFQQQTESTRQSTLFRSLNIKTITGDLRKILSDNPEARVKPIPQGLKETISLFLADRDPVLLTRVGEEWPDCELSRLIDKHTGQGMLIIRQGKGNLPWIAHLTPREEPQSEFGMARPVDRDDLLRFIHSGAAWLRFQEGAQ